MFDFKFCTITHSMLNDRPPFTKMVEIDEQPIINGYTLQVDVDNQQASIINLKKGGNCSMSIQTVRKALEGLEDVYEQLLEKKANNNAKKEAEKQAIIDRHEAEKQVEFAEIDNKYANLLTRIDNAILDASDEVEIEVPDTTEDAAITDAPVQTDAQNDNEIVNEIVNETEIL